MADPFSDLGGMASSIFQATQVPETQTFMQNLFKTLHGLYGTLGIQKTKKLNQLLSIPEAERTAKQTEQIKQLQAITDTSPKFMDSFLEQQKKYEPQFDQLTMDRLVKLMPQLSQLSTDTYAQTAPKLTSAATEVMRAAAPDYMKLQGDVTQYANQNLGQGLNEQQLQFFRNQMMGAQAAKGLMDSPLGSTQEAMYLTQLNMAQQQQNYQNALAAQQAYKLPPLPGYPSITPQGLQSMLPQQGVFQLPSFGQMMGTQQQAQNDQIARNMYQNQLVGNAIQYGTQFVGDTASMIAGGGFGGGMMGAMGGAGGWGEPPGGISWSKQMSPNPAGWAQQQF